jgi:hypothetical protein
MKNWLIILMIALATGAIAFVGVPVFKAWATTDACLHDPSLTQVGSGHKYFPCGYQFIVWHEGKNGGDNSCECAHRTTSVTLHILDSNHQNDYSIPMSKISVLDCGIDPSDQESQWCAHAHIPYGQWYYYFKCDSIYGGETLPSSTPYSSLYNGNPSCLSEVILEGEACD